MDEALDLLEKRIETLGRVLGPIPDADVKGNENFADSLLSAHTLISSAINGRENITKVADRSKELENYLDPNFVEQIQQVKSKEVYINSIGPELADTFNKLEKIKSLEPTLGAEYFRNIPGDTENLKELSDRNAEFQEQNQLLEETLIIAMKRYGEIQSGLFESLNEMNQRLNAIEDRIQKKKDVDQ